MWHLVLCFVAPDHSVSAVVHGCPESTDADEALSDAMNYITVIPHPCTHGHSLQVRHNIML